MAKKIIYTQEQEAEIAKIEDKITILEDKIKGKLITKIEKEKYKKLITQFKDKLKVIKQEAKENS